MRLHNIPPLLLMPAFLVCGGQATAPSSAKPALISVSQDFAVEKGDTSLSFTFHGKPLTTYRFATAPDDPDFQRPYFWPVKALDGTDVTSDQMQEFHKDPKADHPHQRSIWVGHGDVNGANHWTRSPEQQRHVRFEKVSADGFTEFLTWDGKGTTTPVLSEKRIVQLVPLGGSWAFDITSELTAENGPVTFKCKPLNVSGVEAGLCSVRVAKAITDAPDTQKWITTDTAKGEADSRAKPAPWCDYTGIIHNEKYGVALINDPANPGGDTAWHVRMFGLLAHIGPLNWTLDAGKTATFHHLIVIHKDDAAVAGIDGIAKSWRKK